MPDTKMDEAIAIAKQVVSILNQWAADAGEADKLRKVSHALLDAISPGAQYRAGMEAALQIASKVTSDQGDGDDEWWQGYAGARTDGALAIRAAIAALPASPEPVRSHSYGLLKNLVDAAYSTLCESNGISDNEWRTQDGVAIPEYPVGSFVVALNKLDKAWSAADDYVKSRTIVPEPAPVVMAEFQEPTRAQEAAMERVVAARRLCEIINLEHHLEQSGAAPCPLCGGIADWQRFAMPDKMMIIAECRTRGCISLNRPSG